MLAPVVQYLGSIPRCIKSSEWVHVLFSGVLIVLLFNFYFFILLLGGCLYLWKRLVLTMAFSFLQATLFDGSTSYRL
jgi:hypothetical protein